MKNKLSEQGSKDINTINNIIIERLKQEDEDFIIHHNNMLKVKSDYFFLLPFNPSFSVSYFLSILLSFSIGYTNLGVFLSCGIFSYLILNIQKIFILADSTSKIEEMFSRIMNKKVNEEDKKTLEKNNIKFSQSEDLTYLDLNTLKMLILSGKITR